MYKSVYNATETLSPNAYFAAVWKPSASSERLANHKPPFCIGAKLDSSRPGESSFYPKKFQKNARNLLNPLWPALLMPIYMGNNLKIENTIHYDSNFIILKLLMETGKGPKNVGTHW